MGFSSNSVIRKLRERVSEVKEHLTPARDERSGQRPNSGSDDPTADDLMRALPNLFSHRARRVHCADGRCHVELRDLDAGEFQELARLLLDRMEETEDVALVDVNSITGRAVFEFPSDSLGWRYFDNVLQNAENAAGFGDRPFPNHRPNYPADAVYLARLLLQVGTEFAATGLGTALKVVGYKPSEAEFDLAALVSFVENTPRVRGWLENVLGNDAVDVALGTSGTVVNAVGGGPLGPSLTLILQTMNLRAELARRHAWRLREDALFDIGRMSQTIENEAPQRPRPLPEGRIESYADDALFASLGGFAIGLVDTENLEASFSPLFGGLPKAARFGRSAFVAEIMTALGDRGVLALRPSVLECFERVDAIVLDDGVLSLPDGLDEHAENLIDAVRRADLHLTIVGDRNATETVGADDYIDVTAEAWRSKTLTDTIQRLQREGHVVALVTRRSDRALLASDVGIGLHREGLAPWEADIITTEALDDVTFIVQAFAESRRVADESIVLTAAGAALGMLTPIGTGIDKNAPGRIMLAVNVATALALANGVRRAEQLVKQPRPSTADRTEWHSLPGDEVLERTASSRGGLTSAEASDRCSDEETDTGWPQMLATSIGRELMNPFTPILAGGAVMSSIVGSAADAAIVTSAIGLSSLIGGLERFKAQQTIQDLEQQERALVRTLRDGEPTEVEASDIVVGDVLLFEAGDVVPADCRLLECNSLEADESTLTGESLSVSKDPATANADQVAERTSMLFAGTAVAVGTGRAVVVATGDDTQIARAARLAEAPPESGVEARLREISEITLPVAGLSGALLTGVGLLRGRKMKEIVGSSVGLAVASVPEGLPILATIAQLAAARRLARRGIIVRNPRTIEALGRVDILCADKTGTLTEGTLKLHGVANGATHNVPEIASSQIGHDILQGALRATPHGERVPHATDRAVITVGENAGVAPGDWVPGESLPFGPERSYHAVVGEAAGGHLVFVKGAPESLLPRCEMSASDRERLSEEADELAAQGLRVLCVAKRTVPGGAKLTDEEISGLQFLGFVMLSDPIRPSAADAVSQLRDAGITPVMITGDHPRTARRIATQAGVVSESDPDTAIITGMEIDELGDEELSEALEKVRVVARATPLHKVRIVKMLQGRGHTVAMTGDGGNDASAIRLADVGIALGSDSSKAARHSADMIVVDPHLETIVDGIAEGRAMWPSVQDAVSILVGGNLGEIGFTVASGVLSAKSGLNTRQLLLVNLLTDIAPAISIALRPPTSADRARLLAQSLDSALGEELEEEIVKRAAATAAGASLAWTASSLLRSNPERISTTALLALVGSQLGQTLAAGERTTATTLASVGSAALMLGLVETPGVSKLFGCRPVGPISLGIAASSSVAATLGAKFGPAMLERFRERLHDAVEEPTKPQRRPQPIHDEHESQWPWELSMNFAAG